MNIHRQDRSMKVTPGPIGARFVAQIIDALILMPVGLVLKSILYAEGLITVGVLLANLAYYVYFISGPWQATPGKRIMGVYVTDIAGDALSREGAALRFFAFIIPWLPVYMSISSVAVSSLLIWLHIIWFLPLLLTEYKRGLHDYLAYTRCIEGRLSI